MVAIAFSELEPWEKNYLKKQLGKHTLIFLDEPFSEKSAQALKNADIICAFIYSKINKNLLAKLPKIKLIVTMSTGYDHIDVKACAARKVTVCNVPSYGENTVAEHTFALLLAVARKLVDSIERTRKADFELEGLLGTDLKGKTLGIVGTGKIGRNVAHIGGEGFGMRVIAYDAFPNHEWAKECGIKYVPFEKLLAESDVITFHVPLTKETKHMLNTKNLAKVKKGAILLNTSRGGVIETKAIIAGVKQGIFSGVGLDVLEEECAIKEEKEMLAEKFKEKCDVKTLLAEHVLLQMPNVYITPHSAFYSREALQRILDTTVENINAFLAGKPVNTVK
jgi:D-lactate dehydrogenase